MSGRMPTPRIVAYTATTGRALVQCGETAAWMGADDVLALAGEWLDLGNDIREKNGAVDQIVMYLP